MHHSFAILGRQPALGIAELESLFGSENVMPFGAQACFISNHVNDEMFSRLGGSIRVCETLTKVVSNTWFDIRDELERQFSRHCENRTAKVSFGISAFGAQLSAKKLQQAALSFKKQQKANGHSIRVVPHKDLQLGSAVVLHNKLAADPNIELVIISDGASTYIGKTTHIQDIESYAKRDRKRPHRDAKVGMLPPKLAQIITNLSAKDTDPKNGIIVLDPFCGTGVIMQEAALMGFDVYGTDISERMIEYTSDNFHWLIGENRRGTFEVADGTTHTWKPLPQFVACETFLGQPLSKIPPKDQFEKIIISVNKLHKKFFQNIATQVKAGTNLCCAVPAWRIGNTFSRLPIIDELTDMGYTRRKFKHVRNEDLIYWREGQVVARELLVLEKR